jgi:1-acyl-sn-glycerol-3-phosphate acyltransferase
MSDDKHDLPPAGERTSGGKTDEFADLTIGTHRKVGRWLFASFLIGVFRLFGLRIQGRENIPATGPLIVVSNHLHNADPVILAAAMPRPIHFMAKAEAFEVPVIRRILRWGGAFPVQRGKMDRWAMRRAEATLEQGIVLGIYPEGTRSRTLSLKEPLGGAGLFLLRSGAPVLPVIITGSERLPGNGKKGKLAPGVVMPDPGHRGVRLRFGKPVIIPREIDGRRISAAEASDLMMLELARMLPPSYRGIYGDRVTGEPTA